MVILKADSIPSRKVEEILRTMNKLLPEEGREQKVLTPKDVTVQMFACGNLNSTYHVEIRKNSNTFSLAKYLPATAFVIKIFNTDAALPVDHHSSAVAQVLIGQSDLGPSIYLVTPQAIVMESLVASRARIANLYDDQEPNFRRALASTLARFHSLPVATERNQALEYLEDTLLNGGSWNSEEVLASLTSGWMRETLEKFDCRNLTEVKKFKAEVKWLVERVRREHPNLGIVFSHNDFNHSNVLVLEAEESSSSEDDDEKEDKTEMKKPPPPPADYNIKLVDFDFSRYFYRGADFGRYFLDYTDPAVEDTPTSPDASSISEPVMLEYIEHYRNECAHILSTDDKLLINKYLKDPRNSAQKILAEAKLFMLYYALLSVFQATWAASFRQEETMEGCLIWADMCFGRYQRLKAKYFSPAEAEQKKKEETKRTNRKSLKSFSKNEPQHQKIVQPHHHHQSKLQAKA